MRSPPANAPCLLFPAQAGLFYLLAVPYQIGFERSPDLNEFHYTAYGVDLVLLLIGLCNLIRGGTRGSHQVRQCTPFPPPRTPRHCAPARLHTRGLLPASRSW